MSGLLNLLRHKVSAFFSSVSPSLYPVVLFGIRPGCSRSLVLLALCLAVKLCKLILLDNLNKFVCIFRVCRISSSLNSVASLLIVCFSDYFFIALICLQKCAMVCNGFFPAIISAESFAFHGYQIYPVVALFCIFAIYFTLPGLCSLNSEKGFTLCGKPGRSPARFRDSLGDCQTCQHSAFLHISGRKRAHCFNKVFLFCIHIEAPLYSRQACYSYPTVDSLKLCFLYSFICLYLVYRVSFAA